MKKCSKCKYWERKELKELGTCNCDKFVYTGEGFPTPIDGLGYWDCESYKAGFETGQDFGCIHFQRRTK